jgi:hypothetical protein
MKLASLVTLFALSACVPEDERCDPDQRYSYGLCYQTETSVPPDAGPAHSYEHFEDVCVTDGDCAAPTDYCAKWPSDPTGYCTRTGCLTDMSLCPAGWSCVDLSVYLAGLPAVCLRP